MIEILILLKKSFNRTIIDVSLFIYEDPKDNFTLEEYLLDILFKNEPIIINVTK